MYESPASTLTRALTRSSTAPLPGWSRLAATFLWATLGLAAAALAFAPASASARPNVVVVLTNDQRVKDLHVMRGVNRALVRKGVTFRNNFATYPVCCPSRVTFLTGQYAHNHHVTANVPPHGGYPDFVHDVPPHRLLPVRLHRAHYRTGYVGTYLNDYGRSSPTEIPRGWDRWYGLTSDTAGRMYGYTLNVNGRLRHYGSDPSDYQTDVLARKAARFVSRSSNHTSPFFLTLAPFTPHE